MDIPEKSNIFENIDKDLRNDLVKLYKIHIDKIVKEYEDNKISEQDYSNYILKFVRDSILLSIWYSKSVTESCFGNDCNEFIGKLINDVYIRVYKRN